jgi:hypothetical protein
VRTTLGALRRILREEAMVPGRWYGGEEPEGYDRERVGDPLGMDETDGRMEGDAMGNGFDPEDDNELHISDHLRGPEEKTSLGDPPDETVREAAWVNRAAKQYLLQEEPAVATGSDPRNAKGAYAPFDMVKDHTGTDDLSSTWYRSPGREPGGDGDPFRGADPYSQLGFHPPRGQKDPTASPPKADGEDGVAARLAPPIWQLSGGGDTSKMLGANAKPASSDVGSGDGSEEAEEAGGDGVSDDESGAQGEEQG